MKLKIYTYSKKVSRTHREKFDKGFKRKDDREENIAIVQKRIHVWRPIEDNVKSDRVRSDVSDIHAIILHAVLVETHEDNIDGDTKGDEQLNEGVKYDEG